MFQLLEMTPWWIYLLFAYFLILGLRAANPTTASVKKLASIPIFFLGWSLYNLITDLESRYPLLLFWFFALLAGFFLGYLQVRNWPLRIDSERRIIVLPGSWSTLVLCVSIFVLKYFYGLAYATNPTAIQHSGIFGSDMVFSGLIAGMFWGRFWHFSRSIYQKD